MSEIDHRVGVAEVQMPLTTDTETSESLAAKVNGFLNSPNISDDGGERTYKRRKAAGGSRGGVQKEVIPVATEARRESHKIIEQRRRQKISEKINELRELLNYPEGVQNKAVVLQAAVENIKNLKMAVHKLVEHHRQAQEDYIHLLHENERLKSFLTPEALAQVQAQADPNHSHPVTADGRIDKESWMDPSITANYGAYGYSRNPGEQSPTFHHGGAHGHNLTTLAALSTLDYANDAGESGSEPQEQDDSQNAVHSDSV